MKNTAHIIETERGWVIYPPERPEPVSPCPTYADAVRRCRINGWHVDGEPHDARSEARGWFWIGVAVVVSGFAFGIILGLILGQ